MARRRTHSLRRATFTTLLTLVVVALGACGDGSDEPRPGSVSFGDADDQCESAVLTNDADDEKILRSTLDCFFVEVVAGNPVTVDVDQPTVEGDSILLRYSYDGEFFLLIQDSRLDEFGAGRVDAQRCERLEPTRWLPEGVACSPENHPGFVEASG